MPLIKSGSKAAVSKNISEFHGGKTYNKTTAKFGKRKADLQAVAVALSNARKYAKKAEGGEVSDSNLVKSLMAIRDALGGPPSAAGTIQSVLNAVPAARSGLGPMRGMSPEQSLRFRQPDPQNGMPPIQQTRGQTAPLYSGRGQLTEAAPSDVNVRLTPSEVKHFSEMMKPQYGLLDEIPSAKLSENTLSFDKQHSGQFFNWLDESRQLRNPGERLPPSFYNQRNLRGRMDGLPDNFKIEPLSRGPQYQQQQIPRDGLSEMDTARLAKDQSAVRALTQDQIMRRNERFKTITNAIDAPRQSTARTLRELRDTMRDVHSDKPSPQEMVQYRRSLIREVPKEAQGGFVSRSPGNEIPAQEGALGFNRLYTTDRERFTREPPSPKPEAPQNSFANSRKYAAGGLTQAPWYEKSSARMMTRGSMIHSDVPGRTDQIPLRVKSGSFIVPADIVSGLGQGNSMAGTKEITKRIMNGGIRAPKMKGLKMSFKMPANPASKRMDFAEGGATPDVGIIAAGAEHVITPDEVRLIGHGDIQRGHDHLDSWVLDERKKLIKTLRGLKGPKRD